MSNIKCKCNNYFNEDEFIAHFPSCPNFKIFFKDFDVKFGEILKTYSEEKENLFILRILLKQYTRVLEKKIKNQ
jgi:hypothetical protein